MEDCLNEATVEMQPKSKQQLEHEITSWSVPKNEREWWACHEIARLRAEVEKYRCGCGEPEAERVIHRQDGPCYYSEALQWNQSPAKTEWGAGMMEAAIAVGMDEVAHIYCHESAIDELNNIVTIRQPSSTK